MLVIGWNVTAVRLREADDAILIGISGTELKDGVKVYADKTYELGKSKELTRISRDLIGLALVLSAGTEGVNSILKFFKYSKEDKKATAAANDPTGGMPQRAQLQVSPWRTR